MLGEDESSLADTMRNGKEKPGLREPVPQLPVTAGKQVAAELTGPDNPRMDRDPIADARDLVAEQFPRASWAVVAGSVVTPERTPGSDLDVVVLIPDENAERCGAPFRASTRFRGWPVEIFAETDLALRYFYAKQRALRSVTMARLVAVAGDPGRHQREAEAHMAAGPPEPTRDELDIARYALTDLLDDLTHAVDADEREVITAALWTMAAQKLLLAENRWDGRGKWLLRELRELDPVAARDWVRARSGPEATAAFARTVLDRLGGPLFEGYRAAGPRTAEMVEALRGGIRAE